MSNGAKDIFDKTLEILNRIRAEVKLLSTIKFNRSTLWTVLSLDERRQSTHSSEPNGRVFEQISDTVAGQAIVYPGVVHLINVLSKHEHITGDSDFVETIT